MKKDRTDIIKLFLFLIFFFFTKIIEGQDLLLNKRINLSIDNLTLIETIDSISIIASINFSYNANIIPQDIIVSCTFENEKVITILSQLLDKYNIKCKEVKNQIVLYRLPERTGEKEIEDENLKIEIEKNQQKNLVYDTIITVITDTSFFKLFDTLKILDTIIIYDTIKIKEKEEKKKNVKITRYNKFSIDFSGSANYNLHKLSSSNPELLERIKPTLIPSTGYTFGINMNYFYQGFLIQSGIELNNYKQKFSLSTNENISYIRIDTIGKYYSGISGSDTNWVYLTEEKEVEREIIQNLLTYLNYYYIQIPLLVGYQLKRSAINYEIKAGIIPGFYLGKSGFNEISSDTTNNEIIKAIQGKLNSYNVSLYLSLGISLNLAKRIELIFEPYYFHNLFSIYKSNNLYNQKYYYPGLKVNLRYKIF